MGIDVFVDSDSVANAASICAAAAQTIADYPGAEEEIVPPGQFTSGAVAASEAVTLAHRQAQSAVSMATQLGALFDGLSDTLFAAAVRLDDAEFYAGARGR